MMLATVLSIIVKKQKQPIYPPNGNETAIGYDTPILGNIL